MPTISLDPVFHSSSLRLNYTIAPSFPFNYRKAPYVPFYYRNGPPISISYTSRRVSRRGFCRVRAGGADTAVVERSESADVAVKESFAVKLSQKTEGKISIRLDNGKEKEKESWQLTVGCNIPGKWILHWGVNYVNDVGSEWDQPPVEMRPLGSVPIKDYAIETPMTKSSAAVEGDVYYEVKIDFSTDTQIAAINFVLKDEETGSWYQHKGRDFKVSLIDQLQEDGNIVGARKGSNIWPGSYEKENIFLLSFSYPGAKNYLHEPSEMYINLNQSFSYDVLSFCNIFEKRQVHNSKAFGSESVETSNSAYTSCLSA